MMRLQLVKLVTSTQRRHVVTQLRRFVQSATKPKTKQVSALVEGFVPGKIVNGFTVHKVQDVPELCLTAVYLTHEETGAGFLHIARDDNNNVFNVGFRTTPMDSTGIPHILEHTVLCGSDKYPCRDPFFKMLNRSMATFMNALTGSDYTMYPFATQNQTDFENLLNVYMDAAFNPCLRALDFSQEGWRLEHADVNDASSPIIFKGVVFNEMKGAFANSEQVFAQEMQNKLMPGHTYAHVSGGNPLNIPDLTWEQLRNFHATHYHPSNARFYTYGNFSLHHNLQLVNDRLKKFSRITVNTTVPDEFRWTKPREAHIDCRPDPLLPNPERNTTVAVSYLLNSITDLEEGFTLQILSELLVSGPNSPFYKALLEPNIGSNYSPCVGYSGHTREASFSIGLQGIHADDVAKVKQIIDATFDEVIKTGFPAERIEAILHSIELSMKHVTTNFGLNLGMSVMPLWNHDGDLVLALRINKQIQRFRKHLRENPEFLQDKVKQYFKRNTHRLTLTMSPYAKYEADMQQKEDEKLASKVEALSEGALKEVYAKGQQLAEKQNMQEDLSCLPTLQIGDIPKIMTVYSVDNTKIGDVFVQTCVQPTNGVTYFRGVFDTSCLPTHLKSYIPLLTSVVARLGAGEMDFKQLSQQIELKTGGLSVAGHISDDSAHPTTFEEGLLLYSYCLDQNTGDMFRLWEQIFDRINFSDTERLETIIRMTANDVLSSIPDMGHSYAISVASRDLTPAAALREMYAGMNMVTQVKQLASLEKLDTLVTDLKEIVAQVFVRGRCRFSINSTEEALPTAVSALEKFATQVAPASRSRSEQPSDASALQLSPSRCHYILPFPVNYVSKCLPGVRFTHPDFTSLRLLAQVMTSKYLHREIREKGGAYGGGAGHSSNGIFVFYSYRDPNNVRTLDTFEKAIEWALAGKFTQQDLDEAKLSAFQKVDHPISPGDRGVRVFLNRMSDAMVQAHREQLFSLQKSDLIQAAEKYLVTGNDKGGLCVLGPASDAIKEDDGWKLYTDY